MTAGPLSLIHGNALSIPLADQSVHLIVTSPPYFALRAYADGGQTYDGQLGSEETPHHFLAALWAVMDECWRVLRDDGSCWVNLGDKFSGAGPQSAGKTSDRFLPSTGNSKHWAQVSPKNNGVRAKSRMLLPHRFALGLIDPDYRAFEELRAGLTPTPAAPQWICRMDAVWSKLNGLPESVTDRVRASHEYWLHLVKGERYFAAMDEVRDSYAPETAARYELGYQRTGASLAGQTANGVLRKDGGGPAAPNPLGKLPGSVWPVATEPLQIPDHLPQHFAAFPSEFPRRIVLGWSPSGVCVVCGQPRRPICETQIVKDRGGRQFNPSSGNVGVLGKERVSHLTGYACACPTPDAPTRPSVVLDPFSGTGTTAIVAAALGRHGVGVDLSWDYHRIARWRDQDGGLRAKALGVERPAKQTAGQAALF